jgi:hypothetical protein
MKDRFLPHRFSSDIFIIKALIKETISRSSAVVFVKPGFLIDSKDLDPPFGKFTACH